MARWGTVINGGVCGFSLGSAKKPGKGNAAAFVFLELMVRVGVAFYFWGTRRVKIV